MPPVAGVAQGAMVLHDGVFSDMDSEHMNGVLRPKVDGSIHLDQIFCTDVLDFFIFFSSMAYVVGNRGQSAYSAANSFMAGLAASRRKRGLAASVINIGGIVGEGYVSRNLTSEKQQLLQKAGVDFISEPDFHEIFAEGVLASRAASTAADDNWEISTGLRIDEETEGKTFAENPIFQHLVRRVGDASVTTIRGTRNEKVAIRSRLAQAVTKEDVYNIIQSMCHYLSTHSLNSIHLAQCEELTRGNCTDGLFSKLQASLQLDRDMRSVVDLSLDQVGVDSLVAVTLQEWFFKELQVEIPVMKILNAPSIHHLLLSSLEKVPADVTPKLSIAARTPLETKEPDGVSANRREIGSLVGVQDRTPSNPLKTVAVNEDTSDKETAALTKHYPTIEAIGSPASSSTSLGALDLRPMSPSETTNASSIELTDGSYVVSEPDKRVSVQKEFERVLPMSFPQSRFWFLKTFVQDQSAFNVTTIVSLKGHIDTERLGLAFAGVGKRHEAIRTAFFTKIDSDRHMQGVLSTLPRQLEVTRIEQHAALQDEILEVQRYVFDLASGESIRLKLVSLGADEHWFVLGYHHIAMDGIGNRIFLDELEAAYQGTLMPVENKMLQYPDFTSRQLLEFEQGLWAHQIRSWKDQFIDLPPPLPLLGLSRRRSRPEHSTFSSQSVKVSLNEKTKDRIAHCCRRFKCTPFHFYLAAFSVLLYRHTDGQASDMCIGVADGNRKDPDVVSTLGLFLNLLPIRLGYSEDLSFQRCLGNVRKSCDLAFDNSRVPIEILLKELNIPRSASYTPLFQTLFNYRQSVQDSGTYLGCEAEGELISGGENAYDVSLDVLDSVSRENSVTIAVNSELYANQDAKVLARSYSNLLLRLSKYPAASIVSHPLYLDEDIADAARVGSGRNITSTWPGTIVDRIDIMSNLYPDRVALSDGAEYTLTYEDMRMRANQIAAYLVAQGMKNNSCIGIYQLPGPDLICSLLGIMRAGACCVPLDLKAGVDRLLMVVEDCHPQMILVDENTSRHSELLSKTAAKSKLVSSIVRNAGNLQSSAEFMLNHTSPSSIAVLLYTSGTSGVPKGVPLRHDSCVNFVEHGPPRWGIEEGQDVILQQSSWAFDMALCQSLVCLGWAGTLVVAPVSTRGDPLATVGLLLSQSITFTIATPTEYMSWFNSGVLQRRDKVYPQLCWRGAMTGGEPLNHGLAQNFCSLNKPGFSLVNCYGPCEATFACAESVQTLPPDFPLHSEEKKNIIKTIWERLCALSPLPNSSISVVDDQLKQVPIGVAGQVVIGGAGVANGYFRREELTAAAFVPDKRALVSPDSFYRNHGWTTAHLTGDYGRLDSDGRLLLGGRIAGSTQVKLGGIRMDLEDVENAILRTFADSVSQAVVSLRNSPEYEDGLLVAFLVLLPGLFEAHEQDVFVRQLPRKLPLPQYMKPSVVIALPSIPLTSSHKIDRVAVDAIPFSLGLSNLNDGGVVKIDGHNEDQSFSTRLLQLWRKVLHVQLEPEDSLRGDLDFFHVGGTSLALITLQRLIREEFELSVSIEQLFKASTLQGMATTLGGQALETRVATRSHAIPQEVDDWDIEVAVPQGFHQQAPDAGMARNTQSWPPKTGVIVLTGATGFLGQEILRQLIEVSEVTIVYCVAVRKPARDLLSGKLFNNRKVVVYSGDLGSPRLGLSESMANIIFDEADAVIHAAAEVSFLKSYQSLQPANVFSTKELARMCLRRRIPFHFVSTASVVRLSGLEAMGPVSVARFPPTHGSNGVDGYVATKWVSEVFLENLATDPVFELPVTIHRPSNIIGNEAETDLMSGLIKYSRSARAVPDTSTWKGQLDFVSVQGAAKEIVEQAVSLWTAGAKVENETSPGKVRYVYESGEWIVGFGDILNHVQGGTAKPVRLLPFLEWASVLEEAGMNPLLAAYLRHLIPSEESVLLLPRLVKY